METYDLISSTNKCHKKKSVLRVDPVYVLRYNKKYTIWSLSMVTDTELLQLLEFPG